MPTSDRFEGVGPKLAERVVDALGQNTLDVVPHTPRHQLGEVLADLIHDTYIVVAHLHRGRSLMLAKDNR